MCVATSSLPQVISSQGGVGGRLCRKGPPPSRAAAAAAAERVDGRKRKEREEKPYGAIKSALSFLTATSLGGDGGGKTLPLLLVRRNDTTARNGQSRDSYSTAGVQILR